MSSIQALHVEEVRKGVGPCQFGVGIRDGVPKAFQALRATLKANPDHVVVSLDAVGAHSNIRRDVVEKILATKAATFRAILEQ